MTLRHFLSWKPLFYDVFLPAIRRLGPARCDAILDLLGRLSVILWPPWRHSLTAALGRARPNLAPQSVVPALAANAVRFLARDYPLDVDCDDDVLSRFEVSGFDPLQAALDQGRGAILVGCHLGGHIAAMHWLYRRGVPIRLLVQRPRHVSCALNRRFDRDEPHPQSGFFLRRDLGPRLAAERLLRARAALRDGLAVYLSGDIPWHGPNSRPGRLLGQRHLFLSVWADLAVVTRAPVFFLFAAHKAGGRYALTIDSPVTLAAGDEPAAVANYLARLEAAITASPADAFAHLTWPCYGPPSPCSTSVSADRPGHRVAALPQSP